MIADKTVFVLGAGASLHFPFPLGKGLRQNVKSELQKLCDFDNPNPLRDMVLGVLNFGANYLVQNSVAMMDGLDHAPSIDHYMGQADLEENQQKLLKVLITKDIVTSEIKCLDGQFNPEENWYLDLWHHMNYNLKNPSPEEFWEKNQVYFITFNYDRSLEWFLSQAYAKSHRTDAKRQQKFLELMHERIHHVYGSVGEQGAIYQDQNRFPRTGFGIPGDRRPSVAANHALGNYQHVITFNEALSPERIAEIRKFLSGARVYILGSSLNYENMKILFRREKTEEKLNLKVVGGTCEGISTNSVDRVKQFICKWQELNLHQVWFEPAKCKGFMHTYNYILSYG